jgi:hypothetical protein
MEVADVFIFFHLASAFKESDVGKERGPEEQELMCFPRESVYRVGFMTRDSEIGAHCLQLKSFTASRSDSLPTRLREPSSFYWKASESSTTRLRRCIQSRWMKI